MTETRHALYFAPSEDGPLGRFGAKWLGRDAVTGELLPRPRVNGYDPAFLDEITAAPRHYGFHATLKPPFALAEGRTEAQLREALAAFAERRAPVTAPPLRLAELDGFVCLRPNGNETALAGLAADVVRAFDAFRRPPSAAELAARRAKGLSPTQEALLTRWEAKTRADLIADLTPFVEHTYRDALKADSVCLFRQDDRSRPFVLVERYRLEFPTPRDHGDRSLS